MRYTLWCRCKPPTDLENMILSDGLKHVVLLRPEWWLA